MDYRAFDPNKITLLETRLGEKITAAIGFLIVTAAAVDQALTFLIIRSVTNDDGTRWNMPPLLMGQNVSVKLGVLRTFLVHRVRDRDEMIKSLGRIQECFDKRNLFAHGSTTPGRSPDEVCVQEFKLSGEDRRPQAARYFSVDQIRGFARELVYRAQHLDAEFTGLGIKPIETGEVSPVP